MCSLVKTHTLQHCPKFQNKRGKTKKKNCNYVKPTRPDEQGGPISLGYDRDHSRCQPILDIVGRNNCWWLGMKWLMKAVGIMLSMYILEMQHRMSMKMRKYILTAFPLLGLDLFSCHLLLPRNALKTNRSSHTKFSFQKKKMSVLQQHHGLHTCPK